MLQGRLRQFSILTDPLNFLRKNKINSMAQLLGQTKMSFRTLSGRNGWCNPLFSICSLVISTDFPQLDLPAVAANGIGHDARNEEILCNYPGRDYSAAD
jgi:hypothetical protein